MSTLVLQSGECVWCGSGGPYGATRGHLDWCPPSLAGSTYRSRVTQPKCGDGHNTGAPNWTSLQCQLYAGHRGVHIHIGVQGTMTRW